MDIRDYLLFLTAVINIVLSFFIFFQGKKNQINISYVVFCFFAFLWALSILIFRIVTDTTIALFSIKLAYAAAAGIAASGLYFSSVFPKFEKIIFLKKTLITLPAAIIIFWVLFVPGAIVGELVLRPWGREVFLFKHGYVFYALYFCSVYFTGLAILYKKQKDCRDGNVCQQLSTVFWGILIPSIFGVIFNLFLPSPWLHDFSLIWLGPSFAIIMVAAIASAVIRHQLMNIKVAAAQIFAIFLVAVFVIDLFLTKSLDELLVRFIGFSLIAFLSYLFAKSVASEVRRREETQRLAAELARANESLKMLNQAKNEFISIASHQLRTPLSIIKGYLSMALEGDYGTINKTVRNILEKVYDSNERLARLVRDLLNISRIESGRLEYHFEDVKLNDLAKDLVEGFQMRTKGKNLILKLECAESLPVVSVDVLKIKEVMSNLLDNALKYTEQGEINVMVTKNGEREVMFVVRDTGPGITSDKQNIVFEKFNRRQGAKNMAGGLGIGLYVCKKFIEGHNGRIWVESDGPGKGSKFIFTLPIKK
jgi:signal transduction histidine kinase